MTIGEKISGTGSGKGSEVGAKVGAELSVTFSNSAAESTTIEDFQVMNRSSRDVCDWQYWHSSLFPLESPVWDQVTTRSSEFGFLKRRNIKTPPKLALTALPMENETVFEAPADAQGRQRFNFHLGQMTALLAQTANWPFDRVEIQPRLRGLWNFLDVNMGFVRHPKTDEMTTPYPVGIFYRQFDKKRWHHQDRKYSCTKGLDRIGTGLSASSP